jgi:hypothetical protein
VCAHATSWRRAQPPDDASHVWDEPDKRWVVKPPGAADGGAGDAEDDDME